MGVRRGATTWRRANQSQRSGGAAPAAPFTEVSALPGVNLARRAQCQTTADPGTSGTTLCSTHAAPTRAPPR